MYISFLIYFCKYAILLSISFLLFKFVLFDEPGLAKAPFDPDIMRYKENKTRL
jgi:hypothetical protein